MLKFQFLLNKNSTNLFIFITVWFDEDGNRINQTTETPKQANKTLQKRKNIGYTYRSYKIETSATTDIPIVSVPVIKKKVTTNPLY